MKRCPDISIQEALLPPVDSHALLAGDVTLCQIDQDEQATSHPPTIWLHPYNEKLLLPFGEWSLPKKDVTKSGKSPKGGGGSAPKNKDSKTQIWILFLDFQGFSKYKSTL